MHSSKRIFAILAAALGVAAQGPLAAQAPQGQPPPPSLLQMLPDLRAADRLSADEQRTVERMLEELRAEDPELRAGAAMLLGKYASPTTRDALVAALDDPEVRVRRAVVVSLLENEMLKRPFDTTPLLRLIGDADAEVRRAVSARAGILVNLRRTWQLTTARNPRPNLAPLPPDLVDPWTEALLDPDPIVRRNLIDNHDALGLNASANTAAALLRDTDREVRLRALPLATRILGPAAFAATVSAGLDLDDEQWTLAVTRALASLPGDAALPTLKRLADHPNRSIAHTASIGVLQIEPIDPRTLPIFADLLAGNIASENAERLVNAILQLPSDAALPALRAVIDTPSAAARASALRFWLLLNRDESAARALLNAALGDNDARVRTEAVQHLVTAQTPPPPELRDAILFSEFRDVRGAAFTLAANSDRTEAAEILAELVLDVDTEIRKRALYEIISNGHAGWETVAGASLSDRDPIIRGDAARFLLMRGDPPARSILRAFVAANPGDPLAREIARQLGPKP